MALCTIFVVLIMFKTSKTLLYNPTAGLILMNLYTGCNIISLITNVMYGMPLFRAYRDVMLHLYNQSESIIFQRKRHFTIRFSSVSIKITIRYRYIQVHRFAIHKYSKWDDQMKVSAISYLGTKHILFVGKFNSVIYKWLHILLWNNKINIKVHT